MTPSRTAQARALLAEHQQARNTCISLARSYEADELAKKFGLPNAMIAERLAASSRMAARLGHRAVLESKLPGSVCPPMLLPWLDSKTAQDTSVRLGLAICLAQCKGSLIRSEVAALEALHGEAAVIFAFAAQAELGSLGSSGAINPLALHDVAKARQVGASALLAWLEAHHGQDASWVAHMFRGAEPTHIPVPVTQKLLDLSLAQQTQVLQ